MTIRKGWGLVCALTGVLVWAQSVPTGAWAQAPDSPRAAIMESASPAAPTPATTGPNTALDGDEAKLAIAQDERGQAILTLEFPWKKCARPSLQMALILDAQADPTSLQPLPLDGGPALELWQALVNKINKPVHAGSSELLQTVTTFLPLGRGPLLRVRGMVNSLGKAAAYGVEDKDRTAVVFYMPETWSDAAGTFRLRVSELGQNVKIGDQARLRVWVLSEERVLWAGTIDIPATGPQTSALPESEPGTATAAPQVSSPLGSHPLAEPPGRLPAFREPAPRETPAPATSLSGTSGPTQGPGAHSEGEPSGTWQPRSPDRAAQPPPGSTAAMPPTETTPAPASEPVPVEVVPAPPPATAIMKSPQNVPESHPSQPEWPAAAETPKRSGIDSSETPQSSPPLPSAAPATLLPGAAAVSPGEASQPRAEPVKHDLREMSVDELAAHIEQTWGPTMSPAVRKAWVGGWWNYYKVNNPETVRREVFMKLLKTCYRDQQPGELKEALALLYLRLKQKP